MNRQEFMRRLEQLLEGIPEEEKREAIAYYTSYFEDAGEENEENRYKEDTYHRLRSYRHRSGSRV